MARCQEEVQNAMDAGAVTTAQDLGPASFDSSFGFGLVNADAATEAATP